MQPILLNGGAFNRQAISEEKESADIVLSAVPEIADPEDAAALVDVKRRPKSPADKALGNRDIVQQECLADPFLADLHHRRLGLPPPLPDLAPSVFVFESRKPTLQFLKDRHIDPPRHRLQRVHSIDMGLHAAVAEGALDARDIPWMVTVTDKWSEDARALVPVPAIAPVSPRLRPLGAGDEGRI